MMKKLLLACAMTAICLTAAFPQEVKKEAKEIETKMEAFASKTGQIIKYVDYSLPGLKLYLGETAETRIRKMIVGGEVRYFYQITKTGKYRESTASIEYSDLLQVIKALSALKTDSEKDVTMNPDYLENKFVTEDGMELGYYVKAGKSRWYMRLEKYGSDSTIFINELQTIEDSLTEAKNKIDQLKAGG
jgi:hypothetical protein